MSAAVLKEAARLMRERASDAYSAVDDGDWRFDNLGWNDVQGTTYTVENDTMKVCEAVLEETAVHIASWHPGMAFLVSRLLVEVADSLESRGVTARVKPAEQAAIAVARAYLGRAAS